MGDGLNDAPVPADADIDIGSSSEIAKEAGKILLQHNDTRDRVTALGLWRARMRRIRQNLFWALIDNSLGVPVSAFGWLKPVLTGAAMALSSLSVIVNSSLLNRSRKT